jgi:hypothetical protein
MAPVRSFTLQRQQRNTTESTSNDNQQEKALRKKEKVTRGIKLMIIIR